MDYFDCCQVVELNVGGVVYTTTRTTLTSEPGSLLTEIFSERKLSSAVSNAKQSCFIDRDGVLFRFVLDYLRNGRKLVLPDCFLERKRLIQEADYYRLPGLLEQIKMPLQGAAAVDSTNVNHPGFIVVGYRGTFAFGRDGCQADVKFRKMWRILVSGKVSLCREVFKDTLNESRDVDRGTTDRYTTRFFLKHQFLEQAFDMLQECGFKLLAACGSGTNSAGGDLKPGMDLEESKWNHYNEFVFARE
ncbi:hypothetical protein HELRODRAFT_86882 [Helobdella robusta]|uniref:BTB domain-containing protein n=1 Tax=Helobdella robusta TaxID=6412 RepID=T1G6I7_HELRO|nr:hypothetical protein HELRODRAFT_86882 [Helobdella robusta]ESN95340.1 hypothetical protein HELRODRAFT_86882 [Helobdella robusta]